MYIAEKLRGVREKWLDIARAIGIMLVVLAHILPKNSFIWRYINLFHMPFFFIVSGYLYRNKGTLTQFVKHELKSLWLPYVTCTGIIIVLSPLLNSLHLIEWSELSFKYIGKTLFMLDMGPLLGASWFIQVLFYSTIVYNVLDRMLNMILHKNELAKNVLLDAISIVGLAVGINSTFAFRGSIVLNAIAYLNIGTLLRRNRKIFLNLDYRISVAMLLVVAFIAKDNYASFVANTYTNKVLFLIASLFGSFGILLFSYKLESVELGMLSHIQFIGCNTIGILFFQFVSFKAVILLQILYYRLPLVELSAFPVLYEYSEPVWLIMYFLVGVYVSIALYYPIKLFDRKLLSRISRK